MIGGRKYTLALFAFLVAVVMRGSNLLDGGEFVTMASITVGAYIAGNVAQDFSGRGQG